jgi:benzodiazapine receptor
MEFLPLFAIFFLACCGAGATGMLFPPGDWYKELAKPSWTPPDWVFPVAWTTIYLCISFAGARVAMLPEGGTALAFWGMQAAFSTLWTPVFFGLRRMKGALLVMAFLWPAVAGATWFHWQVDSLAGLAFVPYLVWVTVAMALNASVWRLNPGVKPLRINA